MSVALEYFQRPKTAKLIANFPCSLAISHEFTGEKVIITIDKNKEHYVVRYWNIYKCNPEQVLPPVDDYVIDDPFSEGAIKAAGFVVLKLKYKAIPVAENAANHPMPIPRYNDYFNNYIGNFDAHNLTKEKWLWDGFLKVYHPEIVLLTMSAKRSMSFYSIYAEKELIAEQKNIVCSIYPKSWKQWAVWKKYMLDFIGYPGELIFGRIFVGNFTEKSLEPESNNWIGFDFGSY